jgi:hypothetical protein
MILGSRFLGISNTNNFTKIRQNSKSLFGVSIESRISRLMKKKNRSQKSRWSVPLITTPIFPIVCVHDHALLEDKHTYSSSIMRFIFNLRREKNNSVHTSTYIHWRHAQANWFTSRTLILHCLSELDLSIIGSLLAYTGTQLVLTFSYMWLSNSSRENVIMDMSRLYEYSNSSCRLRFQVYMLWPHTCSNLLELREQVDVSSNKGLPRTHALAQLSRQCPRVAPAGLWLLSHAWFE